MANTARQTLANLVFPADLEVPFQQRQFNPLLKRVNQQEGWLSISSNNELLMRVTAPRAEERKLTDGVVSIKRKRANRRRAGPSLVSRQIKLDPAQPGHLVLMAMEALLTGNIDTLEEYFEPSSMPTASGWAIVLSPRQASVRRQLSRLLLFGEAHHLTKFRTETDGPDHVVRAWVEIDIGIPGDPITAVLDSGS